MKSKINVKARLDRHLRIAKEKINSPSDIKIKKIEKNNDYNYLIVLFFLFLIPFYPEFSFIVYGNNKTEFYRGNIDKNSILESYYSGDNELLQEDVPLMESADSFISINTILSEDRDLEGTVDKDISEYKIQIGDSISVIADKFGVSVNSIYWANNFTSKHIIRPGETIKIPPVSGVIHKVKKGETISSISKSYKVDEDKIIIQNGILKGKGLIVGDELIIPGGIKKVKKPAYVKPRSTYKKTSTYSKRSSSKYVEQSGKYKLVWRRPYSGVAGNCTWYVASYKNVDWRGNANRWIKNAEAKGHRTGQIPKIGAIVQFTGRGYNPRYGHVAIVMDITKTHIIVSDMNYRRLYEVTYRKVPINDRAIDGYIYVN